MLQFNFSKKTVFITGGSRGIGKACAQLFATAGAKVIITYNNNKVAAEETIASLPNAALHKAYCMPAEDAAQTEKVFYEAVQQSGSIDIVVNNAGVFLEHKILELDFTQWQQVWQQTIATNLTAAANLCFFAANHMKAKGGGAIINISSRGAFRGEPDHPAYGASKAGLNALTQSLALALGPHNITVAAVAPGFVATDMAQTYLAGPAGEAVKKQSPLNRVATADEVAHAVAVLASEPFMTGSIIDVNGASYLRS